MDATVDRIVGEIDDRLRAEGTIDRAEHEKTYLKSELTHYGTRVPAIRAATKAAAKRHQIAAHDAVVAVAEVLWSAPVHERRMAAVELLDLKHDLLHPADAPLIERLLREARTWALVDDLALNVMGSLVARYSELSAVLDRWAQDDDFWMRRSALLALLRPLREGAGDWERFATYADAMLDEKEFFIRKAIGWVLRETAKGRPQLVVDWLVPRAGRASGLTIREAIKPLSEAQRAAVEAAR